MSWRGILYEEFKLKEHTLSIHPNDCQLEIAQCKLRIMAKMLDSGNLAVFNMDDNASYDDLAKEFIKNNQIAVDDFIYCLIENSNESKKQDIFNMILNMSTK